jgi:hypothetical protein
MPNWQLALRLSALTNLGSILRAASQSSSADGNSMSLALAVARFWKKAALVGSRLMASE